MQTLRWRHTLRARQVLRRPSWAALLLAWTLACSHGQHVDDLLAFDSAPVLTTNVVVNWLGSATAKQQVSFAAADYVLEAAVLAANQLLPCTLGLHGAAVSSAPRASLPLHLEGSSGQWLVDVTLPSDLGAASSASYPLVLALRPAASATANEASRARDAHAAAALDAQAPLAATTVSTASNDSLVALAGPLRVGGSATANRVSLSPSSSLAYGLTAQLAADLAPAVSTFAALELTNLLLPAQVAAEANVLLGTPAVAASYLPAMRCAIESLLLSNTALAGEVAGLFVKLRGTAAQSVAGAEAATATFGTVLASVASEVATTASSPANGLAATFGSAYASTVANAAASSPRSSPYAPSAVSFTDVDITSAIGGTLTVRAGPSAAGVSGFNLYAGGVTPAQGRLVKLGQVAYSGGGSASFTLPQGTAVPSGASALWAFAVAGQTELNAATSCPLVNVDSYVTALVATPGIGQVTLSFTPAASATSYHLYRSSQAPVSQSDTSLGTVTSPWSDVGLTPNTTYFYALAARHNSAEQALSQTVSATTLPVPAAPVLSVVADTASVTCTWPPVLGATSYNLYRRASSTTTGTSLLALNANSGVIDATASYGVRYSYGVTAVAGSSESALSVEQSVTLGLPPPSLACTAQSATDVNCVVTLPINTDHMQWFRSEVLPVSEADFVAEAFGASFLDAGLTNGNTYYFAARAVDQNGAVSQLSTAVGAVAGGMYVDNGQSGNLTLGQSDFTSSATGVTATTFGSVPTGLALYGNLLLVSDQYVPRILGFARDSLAAGMAASVVVGQGSATTEGVGTGPATFRQLQSLSSTGSPNGPLLLAADVANRRALVFADLSGASYALGAAAVDQMGPLNVVDATTLSGAAAGVAAGGGKLVVADANYHRVLVYNSVPSQSGQAADLVLGQPDFTSALANNGNLSASSLNHPTAVWTDGVRLLIHDSGNGRVLLYHTFPTATFQAADVAIGQASLTASPAGALGAATLASTREAALPAGVTSNGTQIAISDPANHRVLIYNHFPTQSGQAADRVLGQPSFTRGAASAASASSVNTPGAVLFIGLSSLAIADTGNHRVLIY